MRMRRAVVICALPVVMLLAGCHKVLFPDNAPRTQFEAYDRMRGGYTPLEEPDVFGNPQPALRARLSNPQ
ncbi:MAG: hypothetical protein ACYSU7_18630 [Planctomycetota bacterium]|jgi:hypothetical protein